MTTATGQTLQMNYDVLRRLSSVSSDLYTKNYTYKDYSNRTIGLVSQVQYTGLPTSLAFGYTYDALGNIATYTAPDGEVITYTYDNLGQLLSAAGDQNYNYTYTYDSAGNILTANGHTYDYRDADWKDLLTAFDGQEIDYDASGNPLSYYNGTRWNFTWKNGRNLIRASSASGSLSFEYDSDGLRTKKTVSGGATHYYFYAGGQLLRETYGSNVLDFSYDANGYPYALKYNGTTYYYITNLQGDVMYLVDGTGATVAAYEYDPFGNILSATGEMAEINPLRYRGYIYDTETELYFYNGRYYDSKVARWLNANLIANEANGNVNNYNAFAYSEKQIAVQATCANQGVDGSYTISMSFIAGIEICYNVPLYNQQGYSLCWAFCQVMVEDYKSGCVRSNDSATLRAIEISKSVNGDKWNQGGWPTNVSNVFSEWGKPLPTILDIYLALIKYGPIYAYYGGDSGAHLVVVTGVDLKNGLIYTNNPWGYRGVQSYDSFCRRFYGSYFSDMPFGFLIFPDK